LYAIQIYVVLHDFVGLVEKTSVLQGENNYSECLTPDSGLQDGI